MTSDDGSSLLFERPQQIGESTERPAGRNPMFGRPASTPYAGGTGSTGSAASHDRREREDESGISAYRQTQVLGALQDAGTTGLTWSELGERMGWHHGQATGALSVLHKDGAIAALTRRRKRSTIYVLNENVADRPTREPGQTRGNRELADANEALARENGALAQQVRDMLAVLAERDVYIAERNGIIDQHEAKIGELSNALRAAEQQLALAVEFQTRLDIERARFESELILTRHTLAEAQDQVSTLERANHALRVRRALVELNEDEVAVHGRVGAKLMTPDVMEMRDDALIRVSLGVLRTLWTAAGRLAPATLPVRERPAPAAPAEPGPDADPAK